MMRKIIFAAAAVFSVTLSTAAIAQTSTQTPPPVNAGQIPPQNPIAGHCATVTVIPAFPNPQVVITTENNASGSLQSYGPRQITITTGFPIPITLFALKQVFCAPTNSTMTGGSTTGGSTTGGSTTGGPTAGGSMPSGMKMTQ